MKMYRFRSSTRKNYYVIWKNFNQFFIRLDIKPSIWEEHLTLYIGYLIENKKQSATLKSYISMIRAILMINNIKINEDKFLLSSLTRACKLRNDEVSNRFPIHIGILRILLRKVHEIYHKQNYLLVMYRALFSTAYYSLFRVGELMSGSHPVLAKNVHIASNKRKMLFLLTSSKTHRPGDPPQMVKITGIKKGKEVGACPFILLKEFIEHRPIRNDDMELFFIFRDGSPVKPDHFRSVLKLCLHKCGFNPNLYQVHSMSAGCAGNLLKAGVSVETIKKLGCWKSNAVYAYLKC